MKNKKVSYCAQAIVTGAGSGIGRAFALELHRRGGRVVCSDIDLEKAQDTANTIIAAGGKALAVSCDVAKLDQVQSLANTARDWFHGPVSVLINNAGVGIGGQNIEDISIEDWHWVMEINLWGVIHGCNVFLPELKANHFGGIINVASAASFGAAPKMGAYNTTKSAVVALSETMHAEAAGSGVHVSVLCPTLVKTDVIKNARMQESGNGTLMEKSRAQSLMDRFGHTPESVVIKSLDGLDKNRVHVLPQLDARIAWFMKRMTPGNFVRLNGFMASQFQS